MKARFEEIFAQANTQEVKVLVTQVGDRPCSDIAPEKIAHLVNLLRPELEDVIGAPVKTKSSSTDCNIPLSMGIPALCVGVYFGGGAHTREEWVRKDSLKPGLEAAIRIGYALMEDPV